MRRAGRTTTIDVPGASSTPPLVAFAQELGPKFLADVLRSRQEIEPRQLGLAKTYFIRLIEVACTLLRFIPTTFSKETMATILRHFRSCANCRELVVPLFARLVSELALSGPETTELFRANSGWRLFFGIPAFRRIDHRAQDYPSGFPISSTPLMGLCPRLSPPAARQEAKWGRWGGSTTACDWAVQSFAFLHEPVD